MDRFLRFGSDEHFAVYFSGIETENIKLVFIRISRNR